MEIASALLFFHGAYLIVVNIRPGSHTQWDIQWIMKESILKVFENLFSGFSQEEKAR